MRYATLLLTAAVMALMAGCASSGQDQNYKLLQEDRPMFDTRPDPSKPGASRPEIVPPMHIHRLTAPAPQPQQAGMETPADTQPATSSPEPAIEEALRVPGVQPSITGLDRSNWPAITITPASSDTRTQLEEIKQANAAHAIPDGNSCCDSSTKPAAVSQGHWCATHQVTDRLLKGKPAACCGEGKACCQAQAACCANHADKSIKVEACCGHAPAATQPADSADHASHGK